MQKTSAKIEVNPKPDRAEFDRVLKRLLETPPTSREKITKEVRRKGHKKPARILSGDIVNGNRE